MGALRGLATGALRVGYPPSMRGVVVPALAAVLRKHPGLALSAEEAVVRRVERRLADGKLDVGLGYAPARLHRTSMRSPSSTAGSRSSSRRGHPLAGAETVGARQLADEPFALLSRGLRVRARVDAYFAAMRLAPRIALESNAVGTVLAIVRAGLAVTVLPEPRLADAERLVVKRLSPRSALRARGAPVAQGSAAHARGGAVRRGGARPCEENRGVRTGRRIEAVTHIIANRGPTVPKQ